MYSKIYDMQNIIIEMKSNLLDNAKTKLSKHKELGEKSGLSVFQVANLMDRINKNTTEDGFPSPMRFFAN